jgi:hypothetical protein
VATTVEKSLTLAVEVALVVSVTLLPVVAEPTLVPLVVVVTVFSELLVAVVV